MAGSRDFKVKNGLIVSDSATINGKLVVQGVSTFTGNAQLQGNLNVVGTATIGNIVGGYAGFDSDFGQKSTSDLTEGSNLYYTTTRADSDTTSLVDSSYVIARIPDYVTADGTRTLTNKTIVDPLIDSTPLYGQQFGGLSVNVDAQLGNSTQSVLNFTSEDDGDDAVLSLGVNNQFNHAIGVTGTSASNEMIVGFEGSNTSLKVKSGLTTTPFNLSGGTTLLTLSDTGRVSISNTDEAVSKTNASVNIAGGLGVDKNIRGQDIIAAGSLQGTLSAGSLTSRSTNDLSEGSNNLYYTTARFDSDFGDNTTSDLTEGTNLYYTTARADSDAKNAISITDNGGDGSLTYSTSTGVVTYTGPSASEVRAHFSQGTGVTISAGEISIGQPIGPVDSVEFSGMTVTNDVVINGNLTVLGTQDVQSQAELSVSSSLIRLADSNTADTVDIGIVGRYSDDGGTTIRRAGFIRDASNGEWYVFDGLVQPGIDSGAGPYDQTINVNGTGWNLPTWNFGNLRGSYLGFDSDFAAFSSNYVVYTTDFTAVNAGRYAIDTSGGSVTVTLPASPSTGDYVRLIDVANFTTNSCIVDRNGSTIEGLSQNFELDLGQSIIEFIYINNNWQVYTSIGQRGPKGDKGDSADAADFTAQELKSIAYSIALG